MLFDDSRPLFICGSRNMFVKTYLCAERDCHGELGDVDLTKNMYYPLSNARCFQCVTREEYIETRLLFGDNSSSEVDESVHFYFNLLTETKCNVNQCAFHREDAPHCPLLDLFFPIYAMLTTDPMDLKRMEWVIIHPSERDRMERFLAGTLDPMHDLVHELRLQIGKDVQNAKNDFNKRTRE